MKFHLIPRRKLISSPTVDTSSYQCQPSYLDLSLSLTSLIILDKKLHLSEVGLYNERMKTPEVSRGKLNLENLNPFLCPDDGEIKLSKEVYTNRNPFEIESDPDRLNPFVVREERNSSLSNAGTQTPCESQEDINLCKSLTDSENSLGEEITISNYNDNFEVVKF